MHTPFKINGKWSSNVFMGTYMRWLHVNLLGFRPILFWQKLTVYTVCNSYGVGYVGIIMYNTIHIAFLAYIAFYTDSYIPGLALFQHCFAFYCSM